MKDTKMPNSGSSKSSGGGGGAKTQQGSASLHKESSQRADMTKTPSHRNPYPRGLS